MSLEGMHKHLNECHGYHLNELDRNFTLCIPFHKEHHSGYQVIPFWYNSELASTKTHTHGTLPTMKEFKSSY